MLDSVSAFDAIALAVIVISALMAFARGFLRELATLGAFLGAIAAAYSARLLLREPLARLLPEGTHPLAPDAILVISAFLIVYVLVAWLGQSLSRSVNPGEESGLFDHIAGLIFGAIRGVVALIFLAVLLNVAMEPDRMPPFIKDSATYPVFDRAAQFVTRSAENAGSNAASAAPADGEETARGAPL
jgi:membrane protein required for colicin V production